MIRGREAERERERERERQRERETNRAWKEDIQLRVGGKMEK